MDFFKRIERLLRRGGSEISEGFEAPLRLTLEEVEERLSGVLASKKEDAFRRSMGRVEAILTQRSEAMAIVEGLGERELEEGIKDRTYRPILTSKPVYVRGMLEGLKSIRETKPMDFEELEAFHADLLKSLKVIENMQLKQGRYMIYAFREEMLELGAALNRILGEAREMGEEIAEVQEWREEAGAIRNRLDSITGELRRGREEKEEAEKRREKIRSLEAEIEALDEAIQRLEHSREFRKRRKAEEELRDLGSEREEVERAVFSGISPLLRPLRKYQKSIEEGTSDLPKAAFEKLKEYQRSPKEAFRSEDPENPLIERILSDLEDSIETGRIHFGDRERKRTLSRIRTLKEGQVKRWLQRLEGLREEEEDRRRKLASVRSIEEGEEWARRREECRKARADLLSSLPQKPLREDLLEAWKADLERVMSRIEGRPVVIELPERRVDGEQS
jgi:DNA repair exonuclease SbcCD ATPase subunit